MKIVNPSVKKIETKAEYGLNGVFFDIAEAAKICYQTNETKLSDKEFVAMLINKDHGRCLEMGTVYLMWDKNKVNRTDHDNVVFLEYIQKNRYSHWNYQFLDDNIVCATTNLRVVYDMWRVFSNPLEIIEREFWLWRYLCKPTDAHERRYTYDFICSRGCGDDFRTHTTISWLMESTRYCNYSKDKFDEELTFIVPDFNKDDASGDVVRIMYRQLELNYMHLLKIRKEQPQYAKNILPLGIKCHLRGCGFRDAWDNFIYRRNSDAAYPECKMLAEQIKLNEKPINSHINEEY